MPYPVIFRPNHADFLRDPQFKLRLPIGAMWYAHDLLLARKAHIFDEMISPRYDGSRPPIMVKLPDDSHFCIDSKFYDHSKGGYYGEGWIITDFSRFPLITLSPSIHIKSGSKTHYHGFLRKGILSDNLPHLSAIDSAAAYVTEPKG